MPDRVDLALYGLRAVLPRRLGISDETIKVHRRHIYAKFKVSTQSQLFSMFLAREP